jgi:hypothetical protein
MKKEKFLPFSQLPTIEKDLILLILTLSWGSILIALILNFSGYIGDTGDFAFGQVLASIVMASLALLRPKKDIVSILTPIYAILIFYTLEIPRTMILQSLYALTLTALLWRLETRYGNPGLK